MAKAKPEADEEKVSSKLTITTPALHNGKNGVPAIITIGGHRFASNSPSDLNEAKQINLTLAQAGGEF